MCLFSFSFSFIFSHFLCAVLDLALVLAHRPTKTIPHGTIRTTEAGSAATTGATEGRSTTVAETGAITHGAITRTGEEAMATSLIGRVVVEAGTIATRTRTIIHAAPGGGAPALARQRNALAAVPAIPTGPHQDDLDAPGAPATPRAPGPRPHASTVARARPAPRMLQTHAQKARLGNPVRAT